MHFSLIRMAFLPIWEGWTLIFFYPGLWRDIFCWGSWAPTTWISKAPKQNLKGPSTEIQHQFSNFWGSIGPSGKISQGPHWIFRGPGPFTSSPPSLSTTEGLCYKQVDCTTWYWSAVSKWHTQNDTLNQISTSGIREKSNNNSSKYGPTNHKRPVYSNKMTKFCKWAPLPSSVAVAINVTTAHDHCAGSSSRLSDSTVPTLLPGLFWSQERPKFQMHRNSH